MARGEDMYGSMGSVPDSVRVDGSGAQPSGVRANPDDFGAQIGTGLQKLGATGEDVVNHYQEMAVHTATNDAYVNGYAPQVNSIVSEYKKLQGTEAIAQLPAYQKQLKELNNQYLNTGSPMQRELMGGLVARHTISTMDSMSNHADAAFSQHEAIVTAQSIKNASDEAMNNANNPEMVDVQVNRAIGLAKLEGMRKVGFSPEDKPVVDQLANEAGSHVATSVIKQALNNRDSNAANAYFNKYASIISGAEKLALAKQLTDLNTINNADNMIDNLVTGKPAILPGTVQAVATQTKANIAELAQRENFDPNIMFGLHGAESNYGKNIPPTARLKDELQTDPRFRDKGFEDDSLTSSVHNAAKIWNENVPALEKVLGRSAEPKEGYVAYNQGGAGAIALMTAPPNETAVQALSKIMPPQAAMQHVLQNGGTATMSASAFSDHLQDWFQTHYDAQKTTVADGSALPTAIRDHGNTQIPAIQPTTNPHDYLNQFARAEPNLRVQAALIPDEHVRDVFNKKIDAKFNQAKLDNAAWNITQAEVAHQYADDPRYTSMDQIPQTVKSDLSKADQLNFVEKRLKDTNDPKPNDHTFREGFLPTLNRIASDDPTDSINDLAKLQQTYGEQQNIGPSGFKQLATSLKDANTAEGKSKLASQVQFLEALQRKMVAGPSDVEGKAAFEKALPAFFNNPAEKPWEMSMDPDNKNSFVTRNGIQLPTSAQMTSKKIQESVHTISALFGASSADNRAAAVDARTAVAPAEALTPAEQVVDQFNKGKMTRAEAETQFAKLGIKSALQIPRAE